MPAVLIEALKRAHANRIARLQDSSNYGDGGYGDGYGDSGYGDSSYREGPNG